MVCFVVAVFFVDVACLTYVVLFVVCCTLSVVRSTVVAQCMLLVVPYMLFLYALAPVIQAART